MHKISPIHIIYANVRSIRNKMEELETLLLTQDKVINIVAFTETWLNSGEEDFFSFQIIMLFIV